MLTRFNAMDLELFNQMMQKADEENGEDKSESIGNREIALLALGLSTDSCVCW